MSDAHLGFAPADVERAVVSFLPPCRRRMRGSLVINGDLFEFWFEWKSRDSAQEAFAPSRRWRTSSMPVFP